MKLCGYAIADPNDGMILDSFVALGPNGTEDEAWGKFWDSYEGEIIADALEEEASSESVVQRANALGYRFVKVFVE